MLDVLAKIFWANCSFAHFLWVTWANCSRSLICLERLEQFTHGRSFPLSNLSDSLTVAHLSRAMWVNCSLLLIWFEGNERMSEFPALLYCCCNQSLLNWKPIMHLHTIHCESAEIRSAIKGGYLGRVSWEGKRGRWEEGRNGWRCEGGGGEGWGLVQALLVPVVLLPLLLYILYCKAKWFWKIKSTHSPNPNKNLLYPV